MNSFIKMDVAIELLADKISKTTMKFYDTKNPIYQNEIIRLNEERNKMYNGDINTINKIIDVYGQELKEGFRSKNNNDMLWRYERTNR